jgi:hypothetical protein
VWAGGLLTRRMRWGRWWMASGGFLVGGDNFSLEGRREGWVAFFWMVMGLGKGALGMVDWLVWWCGRWDGRGLLR